MNFQHENGSKNLQFQLNVKGLGKSLSLLFLTFTTALPGCMLHAQGLKKCRAEGNCPTGSALERVWVDAIIPVLGCSASISPRRTSPAPCFVSSEPPNCPKLLKKSNFPQIRILACYFLFIDTRALSRNRLYCSVPISASTNLHFTCTHLYASATMFIMMRKGLTQRAGGKQPSCKKIKKAVGEHSLKEKEASRESRGWC